MLLEGIKIAIVVKERVYASDAMEYSPLRRFGKLRTNWNTVLL